jgi:RNA polymerase sigma factor (sigma-70 family)
MANAVHTLLDKTASGIHTYNLGRGIEYSVTEIVDAFSEAIGEKIEIENIIAALKKLKQEYREVITLRYVDELDISEISEITGKGGVAIRVTLHRGLKKLKNLLDKK